MSEKIEGGNSRAEGKIRGWWRRARASVDSLGERWGKGKDLGLVGGVVETVRQVVDEIDIEMGKWAVRRGVQIEVGEQDFWVDWPGSERWYWNALMINAWLFVGDKESEKWQALKRRKEARKKSKADKLKELDGLKGVVTSGESQENADEVGEVDEGEMKVPESDKVIREEMRVEEQDNGEPEADDNRIFQIYDEEVQVEDQPLIHADGEIPLPGVVNQEEIGEKPKNHLDRKKKKRKLKGVDQEGGVTEKPKNLLDSKLNKQNGHISRDKLDEVSRKLANEIVLNRLKPKKTRKNDKKAYLIADLLVLVKDLVDIDEARSVAYKSYPGRAKYKPKEVKGGEEINHRQRLLSREQALQVVAEFRRRGWLRDKKEMKTS